MPVHMHRRWQIADIDDPDVLAEKLTQHSWTLCTGFRFRGYLFLNDDFTEDSAGEWAVVKEETMVQVETITFGWMRNDQERAKRLLQEVSIGKYDIPVWTFGCVDRSRVQTPIEHGQCGRCA